MDADAHRRFARQISLAEVGAAGQARLCAHVVRVEGDPRAAEVAATYLARAGVRIARESDDGSVDAGSARRLHVGSEADVAALAGRAELEVAAAFLAGAFAAVEEIKRTLEVGRPGTLEGLVLSGGDT